MKKYIQQLVSKKSIKIAVYLYSIWFVINLYALSYGLSHLSKCRLLIKDYPKYISQCYDDIIDLTYPFQSVSLEVYDISEFILYTIVIPVIIISLFRLYKLIWNH
jgi:hypothetical protein